MGIPCHPENGQTEENASTWVLEFPVKAPEGCITRKDVTAMDQLKHYKNLQHNWCEHNASMTVYVRDDEWFEVGAFVYEHFDEMSGVSFLPYNEHTYQQAPYQCCTKDDYKKLSKVIVGTLYLIKPSEFKSKVFNNNLLEKFHFVSFFIIFDKEEPAGS